jgi:hypothetical protein
MGLFLSMSGVIACGAEPVVPALRAYAESNAGTLGEADSATAEGDTLLLCECAGGVTVFYPRGFNDWDGASQFLSRHLGKAVFSFHIHDGDLWMYILYEKGVVIDRFNPLPEYWSQLDEEERRSWLGNASTVASRVPGLVPEQISKYLIQWSDELPQPADQQKAYPTDEYHYGEDWQLVDFMSKIGLDYESPGTRYRFSCKPKAYGR